jgi:hypothetical protein
VGAFIVRVDGLRWRAARTVQVGGRSEKIEATALTRTALTGPGYVSANIYRLSDGTARLHPCEMPAGDVVDFVLRAVPEGTAS